MKHFTDKIQTQKLKGMGFPVPVLAGVDAEVGYSAGELIGFLGEHLTDVSSHRMNGFPVSYVLKYKKDVVKTGWTEVRGDLVDRLYDICVGLRGEGII